ncbi:MAG: ATP-binding protein [Clostridium sp.]|nr:ATP-binding protein [Clostridium sp.]MCM1444039.1 ATP-binding protein [Candidatus Amulumruptor caecigallinarius]
MFGKIIYVSDNIAQIERVKDKPITTDLMNMHVIFEDEDKKIVGEVQDISSDIIKVRFLGEIENNRFIGGVLRKPKLTSTIREVNQDEIKIIVGSDSNKSFTLGMSPLYTGIPVNVDINSLLSNHMAIFGNSGSGKSCGVARLLQNVFTKTNVIPYKANFLIFDVYGEYYNAFKDINLINPNFNFKYYTTNKANKNGETIKIPLWLLDIDDFALLLSANNSRQLPIIERMIKLVRIFSSKKETSESYKNHIIAKAIMTVLYTNQTASSKRNDIFSIIANCQTDKFNLNAPVQGIGYVRKFRDCFVIDTSGNFPESNLVTEYINSFINEDLDKYEETELNYFTIHDLEKALEFTLISEGLLRNEKLYDAAISLKVRLHSIAISEYREFLDYPEFITKEQYIASLIVNKGRKAQIVNFSFEDVEDWFAKVAIKIYCKMLFNFSKNLQDRATIPFNIFLEEAHRVVQNDIDRELLGYNIFERIAKEGRKYGLMLNLISQRPVEISDTVVSQISNFLMFKINHPNDLNYIEKMLPNISSEIVEKLKSLQPGTCVAFGHAFKIPLIMKMEMPVPEPSSSNCDVASYWQVNNMR